MRITKSIRAHAIIDQDTEFEVNDDTWRKLIESGMNEDEALEEIRSNAEATVISNSVEVDEIVQVHESSVDA